MQYQTVNGFNPKELTSIFALPSSIVDDHIKLSSEYPSISPGPDLHTSPIWLYDNSFEVFGSKIGRAIFDLGWRYTRLWPAGASSTKRKKTVYMFPYRPLRLIIYKIIVAQ